MTGVHELPDKTKVHYWYKLLHEMLWHQARYLFTREDLCGVSGVDITVGGDHGKGKIKCIEIKSIDYFQTFIEFLTCIIYFLLQGNFEWY